MIVYFLFFMYPPNAPPQWGSVFFDQRMQIEGTFIQNGRIMNLTRPSMTKESVRLLQYVGSPESNNFKFVWVLARNLDAATAISIRMKSNICSPRLAPADDNYEFLGEADIDSRTMQYVFQGHVYVVEKKFVAMVKFLECSGRISQQSVRLDKTTM
ncbi:hypothetical protein DICVIV_08611 [Dictyocaulus viviparus]|uniref:Uncharacterized protein n=1 Tax=Dictyocaulus viviparus TaxID=29172 RepID=A0A0D8XLD0_DICVI|nr:hypothetical protein DICVIV_08611 [Dictyocaulus viviparus]